MKTMRQIMETFHKVPLRLRKGISGENIFCPKCGKTFVYYRQGNLCRHCQSEITYNPEPVFQQDKEMINY